MTKKELESAKTLFFTALGVDIAVTAIVVASDFWGVGVLKDIAGGRITADQSTLGTLEFWDSFAKLMFLTTIGVGLGLVKWLNACYRFAKETLNATEFTNDGWTASGWIIPIFNWFKPYQVINEIYKAGASAYAGPNDWKKESGSGLLLIWWIFYAVTHFIVLIASKQLFKSSMHNDLSLDHAISLTVFQVALCIVSLLIAGLWFVVAGNLTRRLLARQPIGASSPSVAIQSATSNQALGLPSGTQPPRQTSPSALPLLAPNNQIPPPAAMSPSSPTEEDFWATAMNEVETGQRRPGVWAKAFAECDGDETKAKVTYLKARVQQLTSDAREQAAQVEAERLAAIEKEKADTLAREHETVEETLVSELKANYLKKKPTPDEVKYLAVASTRDPSLLSLVDSYQQGATLLHWTAYYGLVEQAQLLLANGANPKAKDYLDRLPAEWCENGPLRQVLETAAKSAASPDAALLEAVVSGNWGAAKTLLNSGIKPTGCDAEGRSLLDLAKARNDTGMISLLNAYGST